jgi:hypothetical protein
MPFVIPPPDFVPQPTTCSLVLKSEWEDSPWPGFDCGTGGTLSLYFVQNRKTGYISGITHAPDIEDQVDLSTPFVASMATIKDSFGRTFTHLPEVFGVSRQTLYNWLKGERPKAAHHSRIHALADAGVAFREAGYRPTPEDLFRTVTRGKSFVELMAEGADGKAAAEKLMRIVRRGLEARGALDQILADSKGGKGQDSLGFIAPTVDESAG